MKHSNTTRMSLIFSAAIIAASFQTVHAQSIQLQPEAGQEMYVEIGTAGPTYSEPGYQATPNGLRIILGKNSGSGFALEGMVLVGLEGGSSNVSGTPVQAKVNEAAGIYMKNRHQFGVQTEIFSRFGYAKVNSTFRVQGRQQELRTGAAGMSYGFGIKKKWNKNTAVTLDYMMYGAKDWGNYSGFAWGVSHNF